MSFYICKMGPHPGLLVYNIYNPHEIQIDLGQTIVNLIIACYRPTNFLEGPTFYEAELIQLRYGDTA